MKKLFILPLILIISISLFAQDIEDEPADEGDDALSSLPTWVNITMRGVFNSTSLSNNNIMNDNNVNYSPFQPGWGAGGQIGVNFTNGITLALEVDYSRLTQEYDLRNTMLGEYNKRMVYPTLDKLLVFKSLGPSGSYLELGPKMSKVMTAWEDNTFPNSSINFENKNLYGNFSHKERFGVFLGFGVGFVFTEIYDLSLGFRASYTISNVMKDDEYPVSDGIYFPTYTSYATTNPFIVELNLNLSFHIGNFKDE